MTNGEAYHKKTTQIAVMIMDLERQMTVKTQ